MKFSEVNAQIKARYDSCPYCGRPWSECQLPVSHVATLFVPPKPLEADEDTTTAPSEPA